jgi:LacI family transcriptional regulator
MTVTIKDIARMVGVSHTTVSRALNNSPLINPETRDKIQEVARKSGYTPNRSARSLVTHKSYNIGLFFTTLHAGTTAWFFQDVVRGISRTLKDDYQLSVKGIDELRDDRLLSRLNYDGIIVMSQSPEDDRFIRRVVERQIPLVVLNRAVKDKCILNIVPDDYRGAYEAVRHLIGCGHRRIGIIEGKAGFHSSELRAAGYRDAMREAGLTPQEALRAIGNYDMKGGYEAMAALIDRARPTAVFCCNDDMAVGALKAAVDRGLRVPQDVSLIGFDDNAFASYVSPALTTVRRPIEEMSRIGAERLLAMLDRPAAAQAAGADAAQAVGQGRHAAQVAGSDTGRNPDAALESVLIETQLVFRDSVSKLQS